MHRRGFSFLLLSFLVFAGFAQQTQLYLDKEIAFKNGLELFDEKNYLAAREKFEDIYKQQKPLIGHQNEILMQNLEYYVAVCAMEAGDKDAEQLLTGYLKNHHETDKRRLIYFYLGKYYYRERKYSDAITYFSKVNISDLTNEQIYDYKFQLGYSYFTKKKFTEAKTLFSSIKDIQGKYYYPATYYYAFICFYTKDYDDALKNFTRIEGSKMYSSVIPYYIAQIYYMKGDYAKVISYIKKNVDQSDASYKEEMKFLLGSVYFQQNEYAKALPLIDEYVSKSSRAKKEHIYQLAYCQYQTGAYQKAIDNFLQLNSLDDKLGQNATYALGDCYLKTNQKDKARSAFQSAASMNYDEAIKQNATFNYAKLSFELGYSSEAIIAFDNYINDYPKGTYTDEASELLVAALVQTKNYDRAYKIMEGLNSESKLIREAYQKVTYFRAIELYNDRRTTEAYNLCEKSLKKPVDIELKALAIYLEAEILYSQEKYNEAANKYSLFAQYSTPVLDRKGEASKFRAIYNRGYCSFKEKEYGDATIYFGDAINESQTTNDTKGKNTLLPDLYQRYSDCAFVTKNYSKAVTGYSKITEMKWKDADYAQYQKGIILGLQNRNADKINALETLTAKYPGSSYVAAANYEIGETYLLQGNLNASRTAYQKVIAGNPNTPLLPKSYLKLAVINYNSGKKEQAITDYKEVVKRFPNSNEAGEALSALKELYVEVGRPDEYFDFVKGSSNISVSSSEEDSLTYQSAEKAYSANEETKAVTLLGNYIIKFPNGIFVNEAHWKKSEIHTKQKDFANALKEYDALIENKYNKYYEQAVLKASGIAYYELKDYQLANKYYKLLYVSSTSSQNSYTAMVGLLRTAVQLNNTTEIIEYADQFINSGTAKNADYQEAMYEKAKAYYNKGDKEFAFGAYNRVTEMPVSEKAVEAKYMVAKILFKKGEYKSSLDTCFRLKNKYSSYEYWIAKTFVLIADNYYMQGNLFQAKATLQSIVENYEGDAKLLAEAKTKLEKIRTEELNKSRILQTMPSDTLIMEQDSLINNY